MQERMLMKKVMAVAAAAVCVVSFLSDAVAAEVGVANPDSSVKLEEAMKQEDPSWFSAGFSTDIYSAYVYRNAVFSDDLVIQPCVWVDFTLFDCLKVGGNVWQNWNITGNWESEGIPRAMNESDFNLHVGANVWQSDDERYALYFQVGHDFFTYRYDYPSENEITFRFEFSNPFVGIYGQYSQAYRPESACLFEIGLAQSWGVGELLDSESDFFKRLSVGFDWNVNFASTRFFYNYIYGGPEADSVTDGIGGTTIKGMLSYEVCDHCTVGLLLAFTSALSGEARDAVDGLGYESYFKDLVWGGLQVGIDF